ATPSPAKQCLSARSARLARCLSIISQATALSEEISMAVRTWIRKLFAPKTRTIRKDLFRFQPRLEALEDRTLLSNPATTGDLITAIQNANTAGGATTITLASHTTFNFTSADNSTNGTNALPVITASITIVGNGDTIDRTGTNVFRLFDVASGGSLTLE